MFDITEAVDFHHLLAGRVQHVAGAGSSGSVHTEDKVLSSYTKIASHLSQVHWLQFSLDQNGDVLLKYRLNPRSEIKRAGVIMHKKNFEGDQHIRSPRVAALKASWSDQKAAATLQRIVKDSLAHIKKQEEKNPKRIEQLEAEWSKYPTQLVPPCPGSATSLHLPKYVKHVHHDTTTARGAAQPRTVTLQPPREVQVDDSDFGWVACDTITAKIQALEAGDANLQTAWADMQKKLTPWVCCKLTVDVQGQLVSEVWGGSKYNLVQKRLGVSVLLTEADIKVRVQPGESGFTSTRNSRRATANALRQLPPESLVHLREFNTGIKNK